MNLSSYHSIHHDSSRRGSVFFSPRSESLLIVRPTIFTLFHECYGAVCWHFKRINRTVHPSATIPDRAVAAAASAQAYPAVDERDSSASDDDDDDGSADDPVAAANRDPPRRQRPQRRLDPTKVDANRPVYSGIAVPTRIDVPTTMMRTRQRATRLIVAPLVAPSSGDRPGCRLIRGSSSDVLPCPSSPVHRRFRPPRPPSPPPLLPTTSPSSTSPTRTPADPTLKGTW